MTWRRPGAKPLSEPMMFSLLMHTCVTRSQWVNLDTCVRNIFIRHDVFMAIDGGIQWTNLTNPLVHLYPYPAMHHLPISVLNSALRDITHSRTSFKNIIITMHLQIRLQKEKLGLLPLSLLKVLLQWNSTSVYTSCAYSTYHLELALGTFICHFISACLVCHTS